MRAFLRCKLKDQNICDVLFLDALELAGILRVQKDGAELEIHAPAGVSDESTNYWASIMAGKLGKVDLPWTVEAVTGTSEVVTEVSE